MAIRLTKITAFLPKAKEAPFGFIDRFVNSILYDFLFEF